MCRCGCIAGVDVYITTQSHSIKSTENKRVPQNNECLLVTKGDLREMRNTTAPFFVLLHKDTLFSTNSLPSTLPMAVLDLLLDFEDVFPDEVGLPPIRGIEHQIDLAPGASLPNRPAYRTNPDETKEIQQQGKRAFGQRVRTRISFSVCCSSSFGPQKGWFLAHVC
jgi:hypothetical protein